MKTFKIIIAIVVLGLIAWGLSSLGDKRPATETGPIKIGVTLPLSGNLAFLGENARDGINLALAEVGDGTKYQYEAVFEDDKFDPATGASTANKLISIDKVDALISFGSPVGNAVTPLAEQNQVLHVGIASDLNIAKGDYNFIHWTPPYEEAKTLVAEMQRRGIKKVIMFEQNQPGVLAVTTAFRKDLAGTDIELVASEKFNTGETDFRSLISKVKNTVADIYLLEATSPEIEILTNQLREAGIKTPITSVESFEFSDQPNLFEGMWYVNAADQGNAFTTKFTTTYGEGPKLGGGNAYDIIKMIVYAAEKAGNGKEKPAAEQLRDEFSRIKNFNGAMGILNLDPDGLVVTKAVVRMIQNGQPVTISQ